VGDFALARYLSDGQLDETFGNAGLVITDVGGALDEIYDLALQRDGRIVAVGRQFYPEAFQKGALVRYARDGTLDPTFGTGGKVSFEWGSNFDEPRTLAIGWDNKIVVAGVRGGSDDIAIARFESDGSLDITFGRAGTVVTDFGATDRANAISLREDGKIRLAGQSGNFFLLARFNNDGSLDPEFGLDGKGYVKTDFEMAGNGNLDVQFARSMSVEPDGRVVVVGVSDGDFALARYLPSGKPDRRFGFRGRVVTPFGGKAESSSLAIQSDAKIVVAGHTTNPEGLKEFAVARYLPDGTVDPDFGDHGTVRTRFQGLSVGACGIAIQPDGNIVVAGSPFAESKCFCLVRYLGQSDQQRMMTPNR
jgi:uncharacterized delta-60 repeat protein